MLLIDVIDAHNGAAAAAAADDDDGVIGVFAVAAIRLHCASSYALLISHTLHYTDSTILTLPTTLPVAPLRML
jgi:hypothetical protein